MDMSKVGTKIKGFLSSIWNIFKSGINLEDGWIPFINSQLKWGFALSARVFAIIGIILAIKYFGILKYVREMVLQDALGIKQQSVDVISSPDINYNTDLVSIDDIIKMIESKRPKKDKVDEKKKK